MIFHPYIYTCNSSLAANASVLKFLLYVSYVAVRSFREKRKKEIGRTHTKPVNHFFVLYFALNDFDSRTNSFLFFLILKNFLQFASAIFFYLKLFSFRTFHAMRNNVFMEFIMMCQWTKYNNFYLSLLLFQYFAIWFFAKQVNAEHFILYRIQRQQQQRQQENKTKVIMLYF